MGGRLLWQQLSRRYLFESRWFNLREDKVLLPGGAEITYTFVEHPGYVVVVPVLNDGRVVMLNVYRYPLRRNLLECPSGAVDGQVPEVAAKRELEEETGYRADKLTHLGRFVGSSGTSSEEYDIFLATGVRLDGRMDREITEQMEVMLLPLAELRERVYHGELADGPSALAILLAGVAISTA